MSTLNVLSLSKGMTASLLLSFLRKQESRVVGCEKGKTLDPLLDWIPD